MFVICNIFQESINLSLYCKDFISLRLAQSSTASIYPSSSSAVTASVTTKSTEATSVIPCASMTVNRNVNVVSPSISSHAGIANILMSAPEPIISTSCCLYQMLLSGMTVIIINITKKHSVLSLIC
jgi:hypothetical protein